MSKSRLLSSLSVKDFGFSELHLGQLRIVAAVNCTTAWVPFFEGRDYSVR
jgi:hypothetical protein